MKRVIFLVDMNAFFISCEATRHPEIFEKPAAVAGDPKDRRGIILTANYAARKFGVKTTMVTHQALKLCPNMILLPPDHHFYESKSKEVMNLLSKYTPIIEQNSIDEAWLDMTGMEKIFGEPMNTAEQIMKRISTTLNLSCSIGISQNKFLAKMASEMKKPLGITELWKDQIKLKLWPLPIRQMYGIGKQTSLKLQNMRIETIGDLAHFNPDFLIKKFGKFGAEMYKLANGIDDSPVKLHSDDEMKSIGRSITLSKDISDLQTAKLVLLRLSDEIGASARKYGKKGHTVQITIKYSNFQTITRQIALPATYLVKEIYSAGIKLLEDNWMPNLPVRLLGISLSSFNKEPTAKQISMFELFEIDDTKKDLEKVDKVETAIDAIRQKYGTSIINRGILLNKNNIK